MRQPPKNRIASEVKKAWKITASIYFIIFWIILIIGFIFMRKYQLPIWPSVLAFVVLSIATYLFIFVIPKLRWRRWRYEVFEQEVYIQHGMLIVTRTLVPMIRVQHVDTSQGPILKKFGLANLTISTAATIHEIPALKEEEASYLRDQISALARVDEDDV